MLQGINTDLAKDFSNCISPVFMEASNTNSSTIPRLIHAMINSPERIADKLSKINGRTYLPEKLMWEPGDKAITTGFGMGIHVRSLGLEYVDPYTE